MSLTVGQVVDVLEETYEGLEQTAAEEKIVVEAERYHHMAQGVWRALKRVEELRRLE